MKLEELPTMKASTLAIVDVGHGNAAVAVANGRVVVIDAGPKVGLLEYLLDRQIDDIDLVLISHADRDHISGLIGLLATGSIKVRRVRMNSDAEKGSELWDDLLYELDCQSKTGAIDVSLSVTAAQTKEFSDEKLTVEVLAPSIYLAGKGPGAETKHGKKITAHMASVVIRLLRSGSPVITLFGDLDEAGLDALAQTGMDTTAPVMFFPHHGGRAGSSDMANFASKLCQLVKPNLVIFSIGRGLYGTPQPAVVKAVKASVRNVRIVCTQLSTHCASELHDPDADHLHPSFALGREPGHCCAGTLVLDLDDVASVMPNAAAHLAFIAKTAPSALCN